MRAAGNDVLILDFPDANGAEYIQRNAFVLIQLIQNVNADLRSRSSSPEPLTIIGPSMSGLVSRYALAYMEQQYNNAGNPATYHKPEWNHNTRLWISFDSPQLGANIPIGDQQWLRYYKEIFEVEAAKQNLDNLDRPAAREMLVHHYRSTGQSVAGDPDFRDRFQTELDNLGMPTQPRRIAVVNGSLAGVRQDGLSSGSQASGCDRAFRFEAKTGAWRLYYLRFLTVTPLIPTKLSSSKVCFSPDYGQTCRTFEGTGFGKSSRRASVTGRPSSISYDVAPGSWRDTQAAIANEGTAVNAKIKGFFTNVFLGGINRPSQTSTFYDVVGKHCFIPTVSALALTNPNRDLGQNLSNINLVCSGETPFDAYFAPTQNEEHITVTTANAAFIKQEINKVTPVPVFTAVPKAICPDGGRAVFSVAGCSARAGQPATIFTWTYDAGITIVSGQGTASVVIESVAGFTGTATLRVVATRAGYAASTPAARFVVVTTGTAILAAPTGVCMQASDFTVTADTYNLSGPFTWSKAPIIAGISSHSDTQATIVPTRAGDVVITLTATNACTGQRQSTSVTVPVVDCPPSPPAVAYPNPADAVLNVAAPGAGPGTTSRTASLYNAQGREVRRTSASQATQLPTADLPAGLYYLLLAQPGHVTRYQIRVQH